MATFTGNTAATALTGAEIVPLNQGGTDKRATAQEIANTYKGGSLTSAINEAKGADIASAATTDIGAAAGNFLTVTGTVSITALGTVQAGTRRAVRFSGALVLTHNAVSLILPTGANITTVAEDIATFVSEGAGNWRCVGYLRANGTALAGSGGFANPMTTAGDLIVGGAAGAATRLAAGATLGHVLTSNGAGAAPSFQAVAGGSAPAVLQVKAGVGQVASSTNIYRNPTSNTRVSFFPVGRAIGKRYFAVKLTTLGSSVALSVGLGQEGYTGTQPGDAAVMDATRSASWGLISSGGAYAAYHGGVTAYGAITPTANDVIVVYVDFTDPLAGKLWWQINGVIPLAGDPAAGTNAAYINLTSLVYPMSSGAAASTSADSVREFDLSSASPFGATIVTGYTAWAA